MWDPLGISIWGCRIGSTVPPFLTVPMEALLLTRAGWGVVSRFMEGEPAASYSWDTSVSDAPSSCKGSIGGGGRSET